MNEHQGKSEYLWESGWDGHEKAQLLRLSRLPLAEKIKWLEEAQELIDRLKREKREEGEVRSQESEDSRLQENRVKRK